MLPSGKVEPALKGDLRPDQLRQNLGGNLLLKAILTDLQFWIPVAVLVGRSRAAGLASLSSLAHHDSYICVNYVLVCTWFAR